MSPRRDAGRVRSSRVAAAALAVASAGASFAAAADDVMRCRSGRLVNVGMSAAQVVGFCGEPKSRSIEEVPVRTFGPTGASIATQHVVRIERWTYDRGQGQFAAALTFEDGELKRIDLVTGR